jgi:hypothetical protein
MTSFKEMVWFSLSLVAAAAVILLFGVFGRMTSDMAAIRHDDITAARRAADAARISAYDGSVITGADVIAVLRSNAVNPEAEITVISDGASLTQTYENADSEQFSLANLAATIRVSDIFAGTADVEARTIEFMKAGS